MELRRRRLLRRQRHRRRALARRAHDRCPLALRLLALLRLRGRLLRLLHLMRLHLRRRHHGGGGLALRLLPRLGLSALGGRTLSIDLGNEHSLEVTVRKQIALEAACATN